MPLWPGKWWKGVGALLGVAFFLTVSGPLPVSAYTTGSLSGASVSFRYVFSNSELNAYRISFTTSSSGFYSAPPITHTQILLHISSGVDFTADIFDANKLLSHPTSYPVVLNSINATHAAFVLLTRLQPSSSYVFTLPANASSIPPLFGTGTLYVMCQTSSAITGTVEHQDVASISIDRSPVPSFQESQLIPTTIVANQVARALVSFRPAFDSELIPRGDPDTPAAFVPLQGVSLVFVWKDLLNTMAVYSAARPVISLDQTSEYFGCGAVFLEFWSESEGGFPNPATCEWQATSDTSNGLLTMKFDPYNGPPVGRLHEVVFHASFVEGLPIASDPSLPTNNTHPMELRLVSSDGFTILQFASLWPTRSAVPQSIVNEDHNPIFTTMEILNTELVDGANATANEIDEVSVRLFARDGGSNRLPPSAELRIILHPLTYWDQNLDRACSIRRLAGIPRPTCQFEKVGHAAPIIRINLDASASPTTDCPGADLSIENNFQCPVYTLENFRLPIRGFFPTEWAAEAYLVTDIAPGQPLRHRATFLASDWQFQPYRVSKTPMAGMKARIQGYTERHYDQENNGIFLAFVAPFNCQSGSSSGSLCKVSFTLPAFFTADPPVASFGPLLTYDITSAIAQATNTADIPTPTTMGTLPTSDVICSSTGNITCHFELRTDRRLLAGVGYGAKITVDNPVKPRQRTDPSNVWQVEMVGTKDPSVGGSPARTTSVVPIEQSTIFPIMGRIRDAYVAPRTLKAATQSTIEVALRPQQAVPQLGSIRLTFPEGYDMVTASGCPPGETEMLDHSEVTAASFDGAVCEARSSAGSMNPGKNELTIQLLQTFLPQDKVVSFVLPFMSPLFPGPPLASFVASVGTLDSNGDLLDSIPLVTSFNTNEDPVAYTAADVAYVLPPFLDDFAFLDVSIAPDDLLPYNVTSSESNVTVIFGVKSPINAVGSTVELWAPYGYELSPTADLDVMPTSSGASQTHPSPLVVNTGTTTLGGSLSNVLRLTLTGVLAAYGTCVFRHSVKVPDVEPGRSEDQPNTSGWMLVIYSDATEPYQRLAGGVVFPPFAVRRLYNLALVPSKRTASDTSQVVVAFSFPTTLVSTADDTAAILIHSPPGFTLPLIRDANGVVVEHCSVYLTLSTDYVSIVGQTTPLPSDVVIECATVTVDGQTLCALKFTLASTPMFSGRTGVNLRVVNPATTPTPSKTNMWTISSYSKFVADSISPFIADGSSSVVADYHQSIDSYAILAPLTRTHIVTAPDIDPNPAVSLFDNRPGYPARVVIAFDTLNTIAAGDVFVLTAPSSFVFPADCSGAVSLLYPLGNEATPVPAKYTPLPQPQSIAWCQGGVRQLSLVFTHPVPEAPSNQTYIIGFSLTNPTSPPVSYEWSVSFGGAEANGIQGYTLAAITDIHIDPLTQNPGETNKITFRFTTSAFLVGTAFLRVKTPKASEFAFFTGCQGFTGAYEVPDAAPADLDYGLGEEYEVDGATCQLEDPFRFDAVQFFFTRQELLPGTYQLSIDVMNPSALSQTVTTSSGISEYDDGDWQLETYSNYVDRVDPQVLLEAGRKKSFPIVPSIPSLGINLTYSGLNETDVSPDAPDAFTHWRNRSAYTHHGGDVELLSVAFTLSQPAMGGDVIVFDFPSEYNLTLRELPVANDSGSRRELLVTDESIYGSCWNFTITPPVSDLAILCQGSELIMSTYKSIIGFSSYIPEWRPVTVTLHVVLPNVKPSVTSLLVLHHRPRRDITSLHEYYDAREADPSGSVSLMQSNRVGLWKVIPRLVDVEINQYEPPKVAINRVTAVELSFVAVTPNAQIINITTDMLFDCSDCVIDGGPAEGGTCIGGLGWATLYLPQPLYTGGVRNVINFRRFTNPPTRGTPNFAISTFANVSGTAVLLDESALIEGYAVTDYITIADAVDCGPLQLNDSDIAPTCTATRPFFEARDNVVRLEVLNLTADIPADSTLKIAPPSGYNFWDETAFLPGSGFPNVTDADSDGLNVTLLNNGTGHASLEVIVPDVISAGENFTFHVRVMNPTLTPELNKWKIAVDTADGEALYNNDGDWEGPQLQGSVTKFELFSLKSNYPEDDNVIQVNFTLASPLERRGLQIRIKAPLGYEFSTLDCFAYENHLVGITVMTPTLAAILMVSRGRVPAAASGFPTPIIIAPDEPCCVWEYPILSPLPDPGLPDGDPSGGPWAQSCAAPLQSLNTAVIKVAYPLKAFVEYSVLLRVKNAANYDPDGEFTFFSHKDDDQTNFVHKTTASAFELIALPVHLAVSDRMFGPDDSKAFISFFSPFSVPPSGTIVVESPLQFGIFCSNDIFERGNLPPATACRGANKITIITLSGSDTLTAYKPYQFAIRVYPLSFEDFEMYGLNQRDNYWSVKLRDQKDDLIHATNDIGGYTPTERGVTLFEVTPSRRAADVIHHLTVTFRTHSVLTANVLHHFVLNAPPGFTFPCANRTHAINRTDPFDVNRNLGIAIDALPVQMARVHSFHDVQPHLYDPDLNVTLQPEWEEHGLPILNDPIMCHETSLSVYFGFGELINEQRYCFRVQVKNPSLYVPNATHPEPFPSWSVWHLAFYRNDIMTEEGWALGFFIDPSEDPLADAFMAEGSRLADVSFLLYAVLIFVASSLAAGFF
ncbi:unnamed protein product [Vitrella brassicaformis CCMP3155]|uniref:Uncharacterized protein n=6 Tax=Vitrella brassicaformis TaxID=1169539 RepID=A0A0G4GRB3_VITBC|nr:unnamed protein product [Vitrella brassicaformis CCMP3155]|eukprot:CEM33075.1 unnamed protein product [Vitrella brassicaformis CCMP3155]